MWRTIQRVLDQRSPCPGTDLPTVLSDVMRSSLLPITNPPHVAARATTRNMLMDNQVPCAGLPRTALDSADPLKNLASKASGGKDFLQCGSPEMKLGNGVLNAYLSCK